METSGVCRTCLLAKDQLISLNGPVPYQKQITYQEILNYCATIQSVSSTQKRQQDGQAHFKFPTHICLRCSKALQVCYNFLKILQQTDKTLQEQRAAYDLNLKFELMDCDVLAYDSIDDKRGSTRGQRNFEIPVAEVIKNDRMLNHNKKYNEHSPVIIKQEELSLDATLGKVATNCEIISSNPINKNENVSTVSHQDEFYLKNAAATLTETNISETFFEEIGTLPEGDFLHPNNAESHNVTEYLLNQIKTGSKVDTDSEVYLQANLNSFVEEVKENQRDASITPFGCQNCKYTTCYIESLRKHYKRTHNVEATAKMLSTTVDQLTHECPECGWESHKIDSVKTHMMNKHNVSKSADVIIRSNINCPLCVRKFKDMRGLHVHLECIHNTGKKEKSATELFKCGKCERQFPTKLSLTTHQRFCINGQKRIDCNLCAKQYESLRKYEAHLCKEHGVEMIHECEVCGKTFKSSFALALHRKRHSQRHFQCDLCPKNYINRSELKVHIERIHKKKPKVVCSTCNESFTSISTLRFHENKEHFKKMHKCNYCNYKCSTTTCLKIHQYIHTGMPYRCKMCPNEYAIRHFMRRHSINVHGIKLAEDDLADMFRENTGYPSRYDTFGNAIYSLDIPEVNEEEVEGELAEYGIKFDDIVKDLFNEKSSCDELLNMF